MYTAKVAITVTSTSLRDLVNTAVSGEIPGRDQFTGRAYQVILIASANTVLLSSRAGTIPANSGVALPANIPITFESPTSNQISIDEIFLSGAGTETVGVMILVL